MNQQALKCTADRDLTTLCRRFRDHLANHDISALLCEWTALRPIIWFNFILPIFPYTCCTPYSRHGFRGCHWLTELDQKPNSPVGEPSYGKPQLGYRLPRSRIRIPRGQGLVSVVDVPYSDLFWRYRCGDFFPRPFCAKVAAIRRTPSVYYIQ